MYRQASNPVWSRAMVHSFALAIQTNPAAALAPALTCHLYTAVSAPINQDVVPADFTAPTFTGYAAVAGVTFGPPVNLDSGEGMGLAGSALFTATAGITPPGQTVLGYFLTDAAGTTLYAAEPFLTPVPFVLSGDFLTVDLMLGAVWLIPAA